MILEGIATTINEDGAVNISPMGPVVDHPISRLTMRPYQTSRTYRNLKRTGEGVFHVTDDVELMARAAVQVVDPPPGLKRAKEVDGWVLADCCRWYEFRVASLDDRDERTRIECVVVHHDRVRDFFGFNRGKHAVVEAAILATRTEMLPMDEIVKKYEELAMIVQKTGGPHESAAFEFLTRFVNSVSQQ